MSNDLPRPSKYGHTMALLAEKRRTRPTASEYWLAREIMHILGYEKWANFEGVIQRAVVSLKQNDVDPSHHIAETGKMVGIGSDSQRRVRDFYLSRIACYLIAMNGDPSKPEIAAAQAYFAVKTRAAELHIESDENERLRLREKVKQSFKTVSGVAKEAGVPNESQPIFHDARYKGLYGMPRRDMLAAKGLGPKENPFDRMGALELSANDFQMNLAAETIEKESVRGERRVIEKNEEVARKVRQTMIDSGSRAPENIPAAEPIKNIQRRIGSHKGPPRNSKAT